MSETLKQFTIKVEGVSVVEARSREVAEERVLPDNGAYDTELIEVGILEEEDNTTSSNRRDSHPTMPPRTMNCPGCGWEIIPFKNIAETNRIYKCNNIDCDEKIVRREEL